MSWSCSHATSHNVIQACVDSERLVFKRVGEAQQWYESASADNTTMNGVIHVGRPLSKFLLWFISP